MELAMFGVGVGLVAHYEPNGPTIAEFVKPPVEHLQKPKVSKI